MRFDKYLSSSPLTSSLIPAEGLANGPIVNDTDQERLLLPDY
jgi:hypothetical protein